MIEEKTIETAFIFFSQKQIITYEESIQEIQAKIELDLAKTPNNVDLLLILGQIQSKYKLQNEESIKICKHVLELEPDNVDALIDIIMILLTKSRKNITNCQLLLDECFSLDPCYWRTYYTQAVVYLFDQKKTDAKQILFKANESFPKILWITIFQAQLYSDSKQQIQKAREIAESVQKNYKLDFETILRIAYIYDSLKLVEETEYFLQKAIQLNPSSAKAQNNMGQFYRYTKKNDEKCIQHCTIACKLDPFSDNSYYNLSLSYFNMGQFQKSKSYLKRCLNINKNHIQAIHRLAYLQFVHLKELKEGQYNISKFLKKFPNNQYANYLLLFMLNQDHEVDLEQSMQIQQTLLNDLKTQFEQEVFINYDNQTKDINKLFK